MRAALILMIVAATGVAHAWPMPPPPPEPEPEPEPEPTEPTELVPTPAELAERIEGLEIQAQRAEVVEDRVTTLSQNLSSLAHLRRFLTIYLDVGWFHVGGNGAGVRSDIGHRYIRDYDDIPAEWVLVGDPLSTAINSRGEPADLGASRAIKTDTINSEGHPSFLVNAIGLTISRTVGRGISVAALVELLPRPGPDLVAVELAHVDYRPSNKHDLVISAGKVDSVLGIEYRAQDAPTRLTVTPSLLCRYICGRPVGVQGRLTEGRLLAAVSLTNGDHFNERFELDAQTSYHRLPTLAAHVQWVAPVGQGLELGVSGAVGPQDGQPAAHVYQWHYGFDLRLRDLDGLDVYAEFVQGKQQGSSAGAALAADAMSLPSPVAHCGIAQCLTYKAAYVLASKRVRPWLAPYARIDWRSARHQHGIDFLYVTRTMRSTAGVHVTVTNRIIAKLEYTANLELGTPQFPNNVLTTSLVVSTD